MDDEGRVIETEKDRPEEGGGKENQSEGAGRSQVTGGRTACERIASAGVCTQTQARQTWKNSVVDVGCARVGTALEWILLTTHSCVDFESTQRVKTWYECRWIIEEYHKGQKTGCGIENPQFSSSDRLHPMIAILSVVACSLLNLRELSRRDDAKTRPATTLFCEEYVSVLSTWRHGDPKPDWTIYDFCLALARLGGHQNRKHDGHPGWLVLWKGWFQFQAMIHGARTQKLIDKCA